MIYDDGGVVEWTNDECPSGVCVCACARARAFRLIHSYYNNLCVRFYYLRANWRDCFQTNPTACYYRLQCTLMESKHTARVWVYKIEIRCYYDSWRAAIYRYRYDWILGEVFKKKRERDLNVELSRSDVYSPSKMENDNC